MLSFFNPNSKTHFDLTSFFKQHYELQLLDEHWNFRILIEHGSLVDKADFRGYTPLFYAVKSGSLPVILELIGNGANVNYKYGKYSKIDSNRFSMHFQIAQKDENNSSSYTKYYIKNKTPLFRARRYEVVKLLLQKGADPNSCATMFKNGEEKHIRGIDHLMEYNPDAARQCYKQNDQITCFL